MLRGKIRKEDHLTEYYEIKKKKMMMIITMIMIVKKEKHPLVFHECINQANLTASQTMKLKLIQVRVDSGNSTRIHSLPIRVGANSDEFEINK